MNCSKCKELNSDSSIYCGKCGFKLVASVVSCRKCGHKNLDTDKYCGMCNFNIHSPVTGDLNWTTAIGLPGSINQKLGVKIFFFVLVPVWFALIIWCSVSL